MNAPHTHTYTQGIKWSTSTVLQETLQQARATGLDCAPTATLPTLQDIDTIQVSRSCTMLQTVGRYAVLSSGLKSV